MYVCLMVQAASETWGISISFISIILIPIVGNAAEHAGAIIFAFKNKLVINRIHLLLYLCLASSYYWKPEFQDISLGVALGSATQISMFAVRF